MRYADRSQPFHMNLSDTAILADRISMYIEIFFVLDGEIRLTVQGETMTLHMNDIILINPNEVFYYESESDILLLHLQIPFEIMQEHLYCNTTKEKNRNYEEMRRILKRLLEEYVTSDERTTSSFGILSIYYALLDLLKAHFADSGQKDMSGSSRKLERKDQIENYMRSGYNRDISLGELAKKLDLSVAYLSRYFKKNFGSNFETMLSRLRLQHVVEDLTLTDDPISLIATRNGFSRGNLLDRSFMNAYHMTPSAFRKEYQAGLKEKSEEQEEKLKKKAIGLLYHEKNNGSREEVLPSREIVIDTTERIPYQKNWDQVVNFGPAAKLLQAEAQKQVLRLKEEIGFAYVRIWDIFSEEMLGQWASDAETLYFHKIDLVMDFLVENNMHPFLDLCRTQNSLKKPQPQADLKAFNFLTAAFLEHVLKRYGRQEVMEWQIELWDRRQDQEESEEEMRAYLDLFRSEYELIKEMLPEVLVGGCGSSNLFHKDSFLWMLKQWKNYAPLPDFFSVHLFAYQRSYSDTSDMIRCSSDHLHITHTIEQIRDIMKQERFEVQKLYVTEWNQTFSDENYLNDSCYRACDMLRTMFQSLGKADLMVYDTGTDLTVETSRNKDLLFGGRGLLSREGIFKPSGFVYTYVKHLFPLCIEVKEDYIVTTDGRGFFGIIAHNGKQLNNRYYAVSEDRLQKDNLWQYYEDQKNRDFRVVLKNVESGMYQVQIWQVNEENGSVLDQWRFLDFCDTSSRGMLRHFKQSVNPGFFYYHVKAEEGRLRFEWRMKANEAILIRMEKIR